MHYEPICGPVISSAKRGKELGFPTANLAISQPHPPIGVYAAEVVVGNTTYQAAVFIGPAETFGELDVKLEAHLLDVELDLYNTELCVQLREFIRPHAVFSSAQELIVAIENDIIAIRNYFK